MNILYVQIKDQESNIDILYVIVENKNDMLNILHHTSENIGKTFEKLYFNLCFD